MGGHYFIRDNEIHYEMAAGKDKDFVVVKAPHTASRHVRLAKRPLGSIRT